MKTTKKNKPLLKVEVDLENGLYIITSCPIRWSAGIVYKDATALLRNYPLSVFDIKFIEFYGF